MNIRGIEDIFPLVVVNDEAARLGNIQTDEGLTASRIRKCLLVKDFAGVISYLQYACWGWSTVVEVCCFPNCDSSDGGRVATNVVTGTVFSFGGFFSSNVLSAVTPKAEVALLFAGIANFVPVAAASIDSFTEFGAA